MNAGALVLGGGCLAAGVLAQGGRFIPPLDVLSHFAPLWLLGAAGSAMWGAAFAGGPARLLLIGVGALGAVAAVALIVPELARGQGARAPATAGGRLRLIQYNAWEMNRDPIAAGTWLADQAPDVIAVEEITPGLRATLLRRGFREQKGMTASIAVFSRAAPLPARVRVPAADWPRLPEFARATLPAPDAQGDFTLVAVHLQWPTLPAASPQAQRMAGFLGLYDRDRLIVAGDFNLTPWSFALRRLDRRFGLERRDRALPTWPARVRLRGRLYDTPAFLPIDHVWAGPAWRTIAVRRGPSMGSDHDPLIVDLALAASR